MTSRQFRIGGFLLSVAFAILGIWALAQAKYGTGTFWLVMSVAWLLLAFFRDNLAGARERHRTRLRPWVNNTIVSNLKAPPSGTWQLGSAGSRFRGKAGAPSYRCFGPIEIPTNK